MAETSNKNILDALKSYWFILFFLGGLVLTWGTMLNKISTIEERLSKTEIQQEISASSIQAILQSQARIETKLEFILKQ